MASPGQPVETLLQATEVYLATVLLVEDTLQVRLPDYVSRCGFAFPAASVNEVMFWAAVEGEIRSRRRSAALIRFPVALSDRVVTVRLRSTGADSWAMLWGPLIDVWVDEPGRELLPAPGSQRIAAALVGPDGVLLASSEQYRAIFGEATPDSTLRWPATLPPDMAAAAEKLLIDLADVTGPTDLTGIAAAPAVERTLVTVHPRPRWFRVHGRRAVQGGTRAPVRVLQLQELTGAEPEQQSLLAQIIREPLTGLYNRRAFFDIAELDVAQTSPFTGVVFADIRRFRRTNDLWGQFAGDRCLIAVADWLSSLARPGELVIRLSGDEFLVLCTAGSRVAARLRQSSDRSVMIGDRSISVSVQAGWASRQPGDSLLSTAARAERALGLAKRETWRTVVGWTAEISHAADAAAGVEEAVQQAVAARQEAVHFQPVVDVATRRVIGLEALVRLGGGAAGLSPDQVIAASHRLGLTPQFATLVYDRAFAEGKRLRERFPGAYIGVNVSREFLGTGLAIDIVLGCARRAGLPLGEVVVELTEDVAGGLSAELLVSEMRRGDELGLRIVIDDFGRGETSLSMLRSLPLSAIKLDRSLLPLADDPKAWRFVAGTASLLRTLTGRLIAEGVETELQCRRLHENGIDVQQGYLFGQPRPVQYWLENEVPIPLL